MRPVAVMDREADFFALFAEQRRLGCVDILLRAMHNRSMGPDAPRLFEQIRDRPEQAHLEILVARSSARRGTRRQKQRPLLAERKAQVALRWMAVELPVPKDSSLRGQRPVHLDAVHVREQGTPQDGEPIEWMLLTSLPVASARDAIRIVEQYRLRWRIEDWHRILKSGCKVEFLGHRTGERIERAVTINAVIAWRLAAMTLMGRETPELPISSSPSSKSASWRTSLSTESCRRQTISVPPC